VAETVSSLFTAIESGDLDAVRRLLAAEPQLVHARGKTLRWIKGESTALQLAVEAGAEDIVHLLVHAGANVNDKASLTGWAPLHLALKNKEIADYLIAHGALVDIHAAAGLGDLAVVRIIVASDADAVNRRGPDGATPLCFAATAEIAAFLLDRGADMEARDEEHHMTPLGWQAGNPEVARVLVARGALVNEPFLAAALGDVAAIQRFLDSDPALIHAATPDDSYYGPGATLLHVAASNGHREVVSLLLRRGARVNAIGGWWNVTPLHWAAQYGWKNIAQALLDHGADVSVRDSEHDGTPLDWAEYFEQKEMIDLLKRQS
jgi:ankyrin repeat protein